MREQLTPHQGERLRTLYRYMSALEHGDEQTLSAVLRDAERDPALERMLLAADDVYQDVDGTVVSPIEADFARELLTDASGAAVSPREPSPALGQLTQSHEPSPRRQTALPTREDLSEHVQHEAVEPAFQAAATPRRSRLGRLAQPVAALLVLGILASYLALVTGHGPGEPGTGTGTGIGTGGYSVQTGVPAGNTVLVVGGNETVTAIRPSDGQMVWRFTFSAATHISSSYGDVTGLIVGNGVVYVDTDGGDVYAVRATNGALLWHQQFSATPRIFFAGDALVVYDQAGAHALNATTGVTLWNHQGDTPVAATTGIVFVVREASDWSINAVRSGDGTPLWTYDSGLGTPHVVLAAGNIAYAYISASTIAGETQPATVVALRLSDGKVVWRQQSPYDDGGMIGLGVLAADSQFVYVQAYAQHYLCAYAVSNGDKAWCTPDLGFAQPVATLNNSVYVGRELGDASNRTFYQQGIVDPQNGTVQWTWRSVALPGGVAGSVVSGDGTVFILTSQGAYAYRLTSGQPLWHAPFNGGQSVLAYGAIATTSTR